MGEVASYISFSSDIYFTIFSVTERSVDVLVGILIFSFFLSIFFFLGVGERGGLH